MRYNTEHKDALGNDIYIGDEVIQFYTWSKGGQHSRSGYVCKATPKRIYVCTEKFYKHDAYGQQGKPEHCVRTGKVIKDDDTSM